MRNLFKTAAVAVGMLGCMTMAASADGLKAAKDVKTAAVVHGAASDAYWSLVKLGVDDSAAMTAATVQYISPQVIDSFEP